MVVSSQAKQDKNSLSISMFAGMGAGTLCTVLCAPLDVVKVRLQIQGSIKTPHKYNGSVLSVLRVIYREEGVRGVFRGMGPALCTIPLFWGVYWPMYDTTKQHLAENHGEISEIKRHLYSALFAGVVTDVITNPFWVTRTRIQTLVMHPEEHATSVSTWQMMRRIYLNEGWLAFYKGLAASFLGLSHVAIQFPLYEHLKKLARERSPDNKETFIDLIASSMFAKLVASSITYPHEVLRARLQDGRSAHTQLNLLPVAKAMFQDEGIASFWSGFHVSVFRIVPATVASFVSYEYITRYLKALQ